MAYRIYGKMKITTESRKMGQAEHFAKCVEMVLYSTQFVFPKTRGQGFQGIIAGAKYLEL